MPYVARVNRLLTEIERLDGMLARGTHTAAERSILLTTRTSLFNQLSATSATRLEERIEPTSSSTIATERELSSPAWVSRFPGSVSIDDLIDPFQHAVRTFLDALRSARASVAISATYRPNERAYLMHYAWAIARGGMAATSVPPNANVPINWVHETTGGAIDTVQSRSAATQMVQGYGEVSQASLTSRHTERRAIDMTIAWQGVLKIADHEGKLVPIASTPRSGMNRALIAVGNGYGVVKAQFNDPPHWSVDGA